MYKWILSLLAVAVSSNLYAIDVGHFSKQKIKINNHPAYKVSSIPALEGYPVKNIGENKFMPTQVFDMQGTANDFYDCEKLFDYIQSLGFSDLFENNISSEYTLSCSNGNDQHFSLKGYLEPTNDQGTVYAEQLIKKLEGSALFDTVFHFEPANTVIYNLILELGTYQDDYQNFHQHVIKTTTLHFRSQREAASVLWHEIEDNLDPDESSKILPLMDKYFFISEDVGQVLLQKSNLVKLHQSMSLIYGNKPSKMMVFADLSKGVLLNERHSVENRS